MLTPKSALPSIKLSCEKGHVCDQFQDGLGRITSTLHHLEHTMVDDNGMMYDPDPSTTRNDPRNPNERNPHDDDRNDPDRTRDTQPMQLPSEIEQDEDDFDDNDVAIDEPRPHQN